MRRRLFTLGAVGMLVLAGMLVWTQVRQPEAVDRAAEADTVRVLHDERAPGSGGFHVPDAPLVAGLRAREREAEVFGRFDTWAGRYLGEVDTEARRGLLREGIQAAEARRAVLYDLIASDPEGALARQVPWGVRRALPSQVEALLEDRVDGIGAYYARVIEAAEPEPEGFRSAIRETVIAEQTYDTFVYGRRLELGSRSRLAVHGIALDSRLAMLDSPVRVLEPGEPVPAGRPVEEVCPISGRTTTPGAPGAPKATIAADTGDRVVHLCAAAHVEMLATRLRAGEEGQDGGDTSSAGTGVTAAGLVEGTKRVLMIRVRFADQPSWFEPESTASAESMFAAADAFYAENSFGATRIEGTVSPVYTLPEAAAWYTANDGSGYGLNMLAAVRAIAADPSGVAANAGLAALNYLDYDFEIIRYTSGPGRFTGQAYVAMRGCWLKVSDPAVLIHELGHNLGLWHANAWKAADPRVPLGEGSNIEYGDAFDTMGPSRGGAWHFNAWQKARLGWLPPAHVSVAGDGGVLTLAAHDLGGMLEGGRRYAVKIPRDGDRDYWLEFRRHAGWRTANPDVHQGIGVRWDPWAKSNGGSQLIDTTPASALGRDDATLTIGRTFSDLAAGIHITPIGHNVDDPAAVDVEIRVGDFASNRRPVVSLVADATAVHVGQAVTFSAAATDPDGDALSYSWTFGETNEAGVSAATVYKIWNESGDHRVRVTVSDRRGASATASLVVRVGESSGSRITGRVVDLNGQPVGGVLVNNGVARDWDDFRETASDTDGTFTLLDVPAGTWNLGAEAPGWLFASEGFSRPVTTPDESGDVTLLGCWRGFSISGLVRRADGTPLAGAIVRTGERAEPTGVSGSFTLLGLSPGRHLVTVEAVDATFDPRVVELGLGDENAVFLTEKTFTISGTITGVGATAATVTTGQHSTSSVAPAGTPAGAARFSLTGVPAGAWALRAVSATERFSPSGFTSPLQVIADVSDIDFVADASQTTAVSGRVLDRGRGLAGVTVAAGGLSTTTDSRGAYWLPGLTAGSHAVTVSAAGLAFDPATQTLDVVSGAISDVDFATTRVNQRPVVNAGPLVLGPADQPFVRLAVEVDDDEGGERARIWWSVVGAAPGQVDFTADGARGARETIARFSAPGDYVIRATVVDQHGAFETAERVVTVLGEASPPVIIEEASAEPAVVGNTLETRLRVRATSGLGESRLTTTWRVEAGAPGPVVFSPNASVEAREATARFSAAGNYLLRVTVRDPSGRTAESSVAVRVETTYASWLSKHFDAASLADPTRQAAVWGELADPDGDGMNNLLEYAFGLDPLIATADGRPETKFVVDGGVEYLGVSFRPNPDAIDLVFEPQVSTDLQVWQAGLVLLPGASDDVLTFRDFAPAAEHQRRFIRVHVSKQP